MLSISAVEGIALPVAICVSSSVSVVYLCVCVCDTGSASLLVDPANRKATDVSNSLGPPIRAPGRRNPEASKVLEIVST